jgi:hypothetical protein
MKELVKGILEEFLKEASGEKGYLIETDHFDIHERSPKGGIDTWVRIDKNDKYTDKFNTIGLMKKYFNEVEGASMKDGDKFLKWAIKQPSTIFGYYFTVMIISTDENKAIKALKNIKRGRDWNYFEITPIIYNNIKYYLVWD